VQLGSVGRPSWSMVWLLQAVVLNHQDYWLMLKAAEGQVVWLADAINAAEPIWHQPGSKQDWVAISDLDGNAALYQLFSGVNAAVGPIGTLLGGNSRVSLCWVGEQSVLGNPQDVEGVLIYNLAQAINGYLTAQKVGMVVLEGEEDASEATEVSSTTGEVLPEEQALVTPLISIPLIIDGMRPKQITLFAPRLDFSY